MKAKFELHMTAEEYDGAWIGTICEMLTNLECELDGAGPAMERGLYSHDGKELGDFKVVIHD